MSETTRPQTTSSELRALRRKNLKRLLHPRHIVFIGGHTCVPAIEAARAAGFEGDIWVVHPTYDTLANQTVFRSLDDLPGVPDAAFVNINKTATLQLVEQLSLQGCGGAVCFAAGFAELGKQGKRQQAEITERAGALALIGPNSTGFLNYFDGVALWPVTDHEPYRVERGVVILSSSGGVLFNYSVNQRSLHAGAMIGVGNQAVLDYSDYVHVLSQDSRVSAIGLVVEDLVNPIAFSHAAGEALAANKPLVILKTGVTTLGAQVAQTHSGALIADDQMMDALIERVGAIRVRSLPELDETLKMLTTTTRPRGRRVAVLTNSGGEKALAADATAGTVIDLKPPSARATRLLSAQIPAFATVSNPLDYNAYFAGAGSNVLAEDNPQLLTQCYRTMIDDGYDVAMMLMGFRTHPDGQIADGSRMQPWIEAVRDSDISTILASTLPEHLPPGHGRELIANGIAPLQGLNEAMWALHHTIVWQENRDRVADTLFTDLGLPQVGHLSKNRRVENEALSKQRLAHYGLTVPPGLSVAPDDAPAAADALGYPVVVKGLTPVIPHKTKAGAIKLNLTDSRDVKNAIESLRNALEHHELELDEVLVEKMVDHGLLELIAGVKFDPRFGHALIFGRGGVSVEHVRDIDTILLPANESQVRHMIAHSTVSMDLTSTALDGVLRALMAIVAFVDACQLEIATLDVNPLLVTTHGEVVALDALIEVAQP